MKFLIISENGCSALAWKLKCEGHDVFYYIKNSTFRDQLLNMVTNIKTIKDGIKENPDVIVIDGSLGVEKLDEDLKNLGLKIVGGSDWANKMVGDQKFAMKAMEGFSIRNPRAFMFASVKQALEFVDGSPQTFRFSTGQYSITPKNKNELLSYMVHVMEDLKYNDKCSITEIIYGCEAVVELWYSQGTPLAPPFTRLETNTMMTGDAGEMAVAQNSVSFSYPTRQPKLVQESLKKIQVFLERMQYTGFLSVHGVVRKGKFYASSFSTSINPSILMLLNEPLSDILLRMAQGDTAKISVKSGFGYSLRVTIPPYPNDISAYESKNIRIEGLSDLKENVFPTYMMADNGGYYTNGSDVLFFASHGDNCFDAERLAVDRFRKLGLVNKQARIGDGAKTAMRRMDDLARQGYEMPPFVTPVKPAIFIADKDCVATQVALS